VVPSSREALAILSDRFYENPSRSINLVGITGTNGKTTVTYFLESIFREQGEKVAVIGTIEYRMGDEVFPAPTTTPASLDLQRMLRNLVQRKFSTVVMEVSSHALTLDRVRGCDFKAALFTNLSSEHLDFHQSMAEYGRAKLKLFATLKGPDRFAVLNQDDKFSHTIKQSIDVPVVTYGILKPAHAQAKDISLSWTGTRFRLSLSKETIDVNISLLGRSNVYNALAAGALAWRWGLSLSVIKRGLERLKAVPGRFEKVEGGYPFTVIVDYAHTADALKRVLESVRELPVRRVITVFGCGGQRDRSKRPVMGEVATGMSDYVIVTSDNPREEDPEKILLDIEVGIKKARRENYKIIADRSEAIAQALRMAEKGDLVIIAGKGHEQYQIIGNQKLPYDDRKMVKQIWKGECKN